ncbi:MAG TPA: hypothetical protein P5277_00795 [Candidatus Paceibacterota bacterium]|nr:hypothetical protein [Candidatus Paceibacterota bacterium]
MKNSLKILVFVFFLVLTLFFVSSYKVGDVVEKKIYSTFCGTTSPIIDYINDHGGTYFGEELVVGLPYSPSTSGHFYINLSVLNPPGCFHGYELAVWEKIAKENSHCLLSNYCDISEGLVCARLYYEVDFRNSFQLDRVARAYYMTTVETCQKCNQEIVRNEKQIDYDGVNGVIRVDMLVSRNKCAFKDKICANGEKFGDPCLGLACPEMHCEINDKNRDGDFDDESDYICVADEKEKSLSEAVSKYTLDAKALEKLYEKGCCDDKVNYQSCSSGILGKKKCCRIGTECCDNRCCYDYQNCISYGPLGSYNFCTDNITICPPEKPVRCDPDPSLANTPDSNSRKPVCCRSDQTCSYAILETPLGDRKIGTCAPLTECENPCGVVADGQPKVCCKPDQECNSISGVPFCQAKDDKSCPSDIPFACTSINPKGPKDIRICCLPGSTCEYNPEDDTPYCGKPKS